jgi:hypothetical protein
MARTELRPELAGICPARMKSRPIDERGYSIPWFVACIDGKHDFRIADGDKRVRALKHHLCWVCGEKLGVKMTFCIGPMCLINRVTSEPGCHLDCATYAARGCPFLTRPKAQYRSANLPEGMTDPPGIALMHNPTACALYTTRSYSVMHVPNGFLIKLGEPESVSFWHQGRIATRAEVDAAIAVGLPKVRAMAEADGPQALKEFEKMVLDAQFWLPVDGTEHAARG